MRKFIVLALLICLAIGLTACGGSGDNGGTNGGGNVDYGGENPRAGTLISQDSTDPNALKPVKPEELVGSIKIPPHPIEFWTLFEYDQLEVSGEVYQGWTVEPKTAEKELAGILKEITYNSDKNLKFWVTVKEDKDLEATKTEKYQASYAADLASSHPEFAEVEKGDFKHTQSLLSGFFVTYTFKKDGSDWKGKQLFYSLRGLRMGPTEFGPSKGVYITAEGPASLWDEEYPKTTEYLFQQVMILQGTE